MYQRIWTPHVGEKPTTVREPGNEHNRFAVAVLEDETLCTVGHLLLDSFYKRFLIMRHISNVAS